MRQRGWWYLAGRSIPLGWCGMWVGGYLGLLLVPLFAFACVAAVRRGKPLFLLYAAPAFVMLGLHAAVANHYTRYNLILIGPFCAGAAWIMMRRWPRAVAFAMASSRASTVISSICARSLRCRFSSISRLITTQT